MSYNFLLFSIIVEHGNVLTASGLLSTFTLPHAGLGPYWGRSIENESWNMENVRTGSNSDWVIEPFETMEHRKTKLLVATKNNGKLAELNGLLANLPIELLSLDDIGSFDEIEETGATFAENAALKASGYAQASRIMTLADDSGLEVEALDNRPGVLSARYGGADLAFDKKMLMLLDELEKTGGSNRRAQFVCAMAVADETGKIVHSAEGICNGIIAQNPRGTGGFGYDPLFIPEGFENTFGELSNAEKQKISHRFRAFCKIIPFLRHFFAI